MRPRVLLLVLPLLLAACGEEGTPSRPAATPATAEAPAYNWREHEDRSAEAAALRNELGLLAGPTGVARIPEVRMRLKELWEQRETGAITPRQYTEQVVFFLRDYIEQNPQVIEHMKRQPRHYEAWSQRLEQVRARSGR